MLLEILVLLLQAATRRGQVTLSQQILASGVCPSYIIFVFSNLGLSLIIAHYVISANPLSLISTQHSSIPHLHSSPMTLNTGYSVPIPEQQPNQGPFLYSHSFPTSSLQFYPPQNGIYGQLNPSPVPQSTSSFPSLTQPILYPHMSPFVHNIPPVQAINSSAHTLGPVATSASKELPLTGHLTQDRMC